MKTLKSLDFPIISFHVFYKGGLEIFSHNFRDLDNKIEKDLIGALFEALFSFANEYYAQEKSIHTCIMGNLSFIYKKTIEPNCLFVFICDNFPNPEYYKILIDGVSQSFISMYHESLISNIESMQKFNNFHEEISRLSEKYFKQIFPLREVFITHSSSGIPLMHKSYREDSDIIEKTILYSGFMTAMRDFSLTATGEFLNSLIYEDFQIIFEGSKQHEVNLSLICEKWADPIYLRTMIQELGEKFIVQYHDVLEDWKGDISIFDQFQKEFDFLPQKYYEDFYKRVKLRKLKLFFSYSAEDKQSFWIKELAESLEQLKYIDKVYYWEHDATGSIIEYMNERVPEVDTCVFFYSEHTNEKSGVRMERDMAVYHNKHIIPVFKEINHVPPIIRFNSGVDVSGKETSEVVDKLYHLISTKFHLNN